MVNNKDAVFLRELKTIPELVLRPFDFFKSVENDKNWSKPIWWAIFSTVFYLLMLSLSAPFFSSLFTYLSTTFPDFTPLIAIIFVSKSVLSESIIYFSALVLGILLLPLAQFIIEKMGGKKPLIQTVKALYYPEVVGKLLGWIPVLNIFVFFWILFLYVKSIMFFQKLSLKKSILYCVVSIILYSLLIVFLLLILGFIYLLVLFGGRAS